MKKKLFLIFLTSFVLYSVQANLVFPNQEGDFGVASFLPSALQEMENQGKFVLFDQEGIPYGFIDNGTFSDTIKYGNATLFPNRNGSIVGGGSVETAAKEIAKLRMDSGSSLDKELLRQQDFLKYTYYSQRYRGLEDFLQEGMGINTRQEAIKLLNSLEPSLGNEFLDIYKALDLKKVGYSHYDKILKALDKLNGEDLSKYIDPDKLQEIQDMLNKIEENVARKALEDITKNMNGDELKLIYELLKRMDYKTVYKIARDYTRKMARDGTLDKIGDTLKKSGVGSKIVNEVGNNAKELVKNKFWDYVPKNMAYYIITAALIVMALSLRRVGG